MNLKKRYNEQVQETQKMKDKLDKITLEYQELTSSLSSSTGQVEEARKEKKLFIAKIS
jgi:hypothetical protein